MAECIVSASVLRKQALAQRCFGEVSSMVNSKMFQIFAHTADAGIRIEANTLDLLFEDAGRGFCSLIVDDLAEIEPRIRKPFKLSGSDVEYLLFDWLNELLFAFEHDRLLFSSFEVKVGADGLEAKAVGEPVDLDRHHLLHEVKAITYHGLAVRQTDGGWDAEVIVDI